MDYTKGALDIKSGGIAECIIKHVGQPAQDWTRFTVGNLKDMTMDARCYALQLEPAKKMVSAVTKYRPWVKDVYDCENRAFAFLNDIAEFAEENGYRYGVARGALAYLSKSANGGYHCAPVLPIWDPKKGDLIPWVIEPKYLFRDGRPDQPEEWKPYKKEIIKWTFVVSPI